MIFVRKLIWDLWNVNHIARHQVFTEEVEEVCHNMPIVLQGQKRKRLVLIGKTEEKRMLTIILESQGKGVYYPITAYSSDDFEVKLYKRIKGGRR